MKEDFEDIAYPILQEGKAEFDLIEDYEISVILLERDFDEYGETFSLSCYLIIELDEGIITEINEDIRVWGGDALGDVDLSLICTSTEIKRMERTERELLKAITEE